MWILSFTSPDIPEHKPGMPPFLVSHFFIPGNCNIQRSFCFGFIYKKVYMSMTVNERKSVVMMTLSRVTYLLFFQTNESDEKF